MKIEMVDISALRSAPYQPPNRAEKRNLKKLRESIKTFGVLQPILVTEKSVIIDGHRRTEAARLENMATIPAVRYNGELDGIKAIEAFAAINDTPRRLNSREALGMYLKGGERAIPARVLGHIKWVEENVGEDFLPYLHEHGYGPFLCTRLSGIAKRCGYATPSKLSKFYRWVIENGEFSRLLLMIREGQRVTSVKNAVEANRPLRRKVSFA